VNGLHRSSAAPPVRLVHLGLGNFFRAHQAWYTANATDAAEWGIAAFTGRSTERSRARVATLRSQEGLYTLITRAAEGDLFEVVHSLSRSHLGNEHAAWLAYLADPQVHVVTTTVTEAGYLRDGNGGLDVQQLEVRTDIQALRADITTPVSTAPAKLVAGLAGRRLAGAGPLTMVPCDNLPGNGAVAAQVIEDLATEVDPELARWITGNVLYATTMVDRITPEPTPEDIGSAEAVTGVRDRAVVVTEPFTEWVISGQFAAGRPRWEDAGATFTTDVAPFEDRKLWMLNGAHSMLAYAASIRGHVSVAEAMGDPRCRTWLDQWWDASSRHLSLPAADNTAYRAALIERFANPRLNHQLHQIASDGSQKLPIRVLPVLRREREAGRLPVGVVRPLAAWVCHLRGRGAKVTDSHAAQFLQLASGPLPEAVRHVLKALDPKLAADQAVVAAVLAQATELGQP
jgi:fructuronate reductase